MMETRNWGVEILGLEENKWIGSLETWDIEIVGQQITARREKGNVALQLRLDPPGRIVVRRLDMRLGDSHILVTERTYAVGRYVTDDFVHWVHAHIGILRSSSFGVAIEFTDPTTLEARDIQFHETGPEMTTQNRQVVMNSNAGVLIKPLGVVLAGLCGSFYLVELAVGKQNLSDMRRIIYTHPEQIGRFISTGETAE